NRLGELWWYTVLLLVAQRFGDVINAFIGLWLVPRYVPQSELGALLPLTKVGNALALPLSILVVVFTKYVNIFAVRGEVGKVKSLLRDAFILTTVCFLATVLYARLLMPWAFVRMRVADGHLGMLVVASGVLAIVSTFFTNALQALKRFRRITVIGVTSAPIRLITLLVAMPIRAITGYFAGLVVPTIYGIGAALYGLKDILFNKSIRPQPYLRQHGREMLKFGMPLLVISIIGMPQGLVESFVIRHRLPDIESAAYYMISRLAEIGAFVGASMTFVLFPLASESHERGDHSQKLILHSMGGTLAVGAVLTLVFWTFGGSILGATAAWRPYVGYVRQLTTLTAIIVIGSATQCFVSHEIAQARFGFYWLAGILGLFESLLLYGVTGFEFFAPWVPRSWVDWVAALRPARLNFVLGIKLLGAILFIVSATILLSLRRAGRSHRALRDGKS
ncbi:MAG: hypothetical protein PHR35_14835, partial [Kiritimatiellae bacterium]|nr:hypothetical protein [Kiritimatiellia bacterium]